MKGNQHVYLLRLIVFRWRVSVGKGILSCTVSEFSCSCGVGQRTSFLFPTLLFVGCLTELSVNKWSKNFDERPHRQGRTFHGGQCNVTPTSRKHCSRLPQSRCHAVYWGLVYPFCCTHRSRDFQCFSMGQTSPEIAVSRGVSWPHLIHGSLSPHGSTPQTASRSVHPFLHSSPVCSTHRHTDHAACMHVA